MRSRIRRVRICLLLAVGLASGAQAADSGFGKAQLQLRLRVESVDEAALAQHATATTLRTRVTWTSPGWQGWQAVVELDDIRAADERAYNSTVNGVTARPVVADPVDTELNRAALEYRRPKYDLALGRQRLALHNHRFIGNVGWRQNEQTYDGITLQWRPTQQVDATLGWVANANRVFGPRNGTQLADYRGDALIADVRVKLQDLGELCVFWYGLAFDNAPASSSATAGVLWNGAAPLGGGWKMPWTMSFATQQDHGDNPANYTAGYRQLELGLARGPVTVRIGQELLDGDAVRTDARFQTPLSTLHAFQGWADKFLVTPPLGIDDRYVMLEANWAGFAWQLHRHEFRAEAADRRYGDEWDASVVRKLGQRWELLGKYADYESRGFGTDTRKLWFMVTGSF